MAVEVSLDLGFMKGSLAFSGSFSDCANVDDEITVAGEGELTLPPLFGDVTLMGSASCNPEAMPVYMLSLRSDEIGVRTDSLTLAVKDVDILVEVRHSSIDFHTLVVSS